MAIKQKVENKKSKLGEILSKEYKWEIYVYLFISIASVLIGVLFLNGTLTISRTIPFIGTIAPAIPWILLVLGGFLFIYSAYPFFKPALPEIKKVTWLKGKQYLGNVIRVFSFLIVFALLFLLYDMFITELLARIMG